jgi:hypothetical protein
MNSEIKYPWIINFYHIHRSFSTPSDAPDRTNISIYNLLHFYLLFSFYSFLKLKLEIRDNISDKERGRTREREKEEKEN